MKINGPHKRMYLPDIIGKGYASFWKHKGRYSVCKGSRASKKSTTAAMRLVSRILEYPLANGLVVRKTYSTLKDSCFAQLKWAIHRLGVDDLFICRQNPLEIEVKATHQKILFRGLDDPLKITSITVERGVLCFAWLEEAYEVDEDAFNRIDESLRGELPEGYFINWAITFNPWDSGSWLKGRFFDVQDDDDILAFTTNYKCNEWLSDIDLKMFEKMQKYDLERYKVAGLGEWGIAEGQFFNQWRADKHVIEPFEIPGTWIKFRCMDWGSAHPYAVLWIAIDYDNNAYVYRELYGWGGKPNVGTGETAKQVGERIASLERKSENVSYGVLDNACWAKTGVTGPTIAEELNNTVYEHSLVSFGKCSKGREEAANVIKERLIGNEQSDGTTKPALFVFSNCIHLIRTLPQLAHDKRNPETYDTNGEDHCFIAGTLITTDRGEIPIEQITTNDMVLTREGYKPVVANGITKHNANVMTVEFSNGRKLTGTANHPIYVKGKEFVPMGELLPGDTVSEVDENCLRNKQKPPTVSYSTVSNSDVTHYLTSNQSVDTTEPAVATESRELTTCTDMYGNTTTEKSQKAGTFITKMRTRLITTYQTLKSCQLTNILACTWLKKCRTRNMSNISVRLWTKSDQKQKNGTGQQKVTNGTCNMAWTLQSKWHSFLKNIRYAFVAVKNMKYHVSTQQRANFVQKNAMQSIVVPAELITKPVNARYAARCLLPINTTVQKPAEKNAVHVACCYTENTQADVYNLTVADCHEYYANGILVHNCVDALAYGLMSRPWSPTPPKEQRPRDRWNEEKSASAWTY